MRRGKSSCLRVFGHSYSNYDFDGGGLRFEKSSEEIGGTFMFSLGRIDSEIELICFVPPRSRSSFSLSQLMRKYFQLWRLPGSQSTGLWTRWVQSRHLRRTPTTLVPIRAFASAKAQAVKLPALQRDIPTTSPLCVTVQLVFWLFYYETITLSHSGCIVFLANGSTGDL